MPEIRLTPAQTKSLVNAKKLVDDVQREVNKAKAHGIDVTAAEALLEDAKKKREQLLAGYGIHE